MSHPVLFTVAVILGVVSIVVGLSTGTAHNVCFGIMFFVARRVLAHADDVNPENPLEEI